MVYDKKEHSITIAKDDKRFRYNLTIFDNLRGETKCMSFGWEDDEIRELKSTVRSELREIFRDLFD